MSKAKQIIQIAITQALACDDASRKKNALSALNDAQCLMMGRDGREVDAANRAITSIKHSVGILHPAYAKAYALFLTME